MINKCEFEIRCDLSCMGEHWCKEAVLSSAEREKKRRKVVVAVVAVEIFFVYLSSSVAIYYN